MSSTYSEPSLSYLVLDFSKQSETRLCLESIKRFTRFEHKVIYLHNGNNEDYPYQLFKDGLIDHFIQTRNNNGLGVGTRDLFAACFSKYAFLLQNDQYLAREFTREEFDELVKRLGMYAIQEGKPTKKIMSISLAGPVCGTDTYSERAHIIKTQVYKYLEWANILGYHGAGPYHDGEWREAQIQKYYAEMGYIHFTDWKPMVIDNGYRARRLNPDGSVWEHHPDDKALYLIKGPVKERYVYPKLSSREWEDVLATQSWEPGKIPEQEVKDSFHVWH